MNAYTLAVRAFFIAQGAFWAVIGGIAIRRRFARAWRVIEDTRAFDDATEINCGLFADGHLPEHAGCARANAPHHAVAAPPTPASATSSSAASCGHCSARRTAVADFRRRNYGRGHSYYLGDRRLDGVTTLISNGLPKPALVNWAARTAAEKAVNEWDALAEESARRRAGPQAHHWQGA